MLTSDWRKYAKLAGLTAAGLTACLILLFAGIWAGYISGQGNAESEYHTERYSADTTQAINDCFLKTNAASRDAQECVTEAIQSGRDSQRSEQDLNAQRQMAAWAKALLVVTIIQLPIGVVGLLALIITIRQGREGLERAGDANRISTAQLRYSYKPSLRPSMEGAYIDECKTPLNTVNDTATRDIKIWSKPYIENIGEHSAEIISSFVFFVGATIPVARHEVNEIREILRPGERLRIYPNDGEWGRDRDHFPGAEEISIIDNPTAYFSATPELRSMLKREPWPVGCRVVYSDPIGNIYQLNFCFKPMTAWGGEPYRRFGGGDLNSDRFIRAAPIG